MAEDGAQARKPRADRLRNRERLVAAAKDAFTKVGAGAPLEAIARSAGVGIGTLYRHFPTREALLAAVYRRELAQLADAAERLLAEMRPLAALEAWLRRLVDYMATKRVIAPALHASPGGGAEAFAQSGPTLMGAMQRLAQAAIASGDIRADIKPDDLVRMLAGLSYGYDQPDWEASARRLITVMLAGLRRGD